MPLTIAALSALSRELSTARGRGLDRARSRGQRRAQGAFFTPEPLVRFVVGMAFEARLARGIRWREDGLPDLRILDPSAGDGRFLAEALRALVELARERGHDANPGRIADACLVGIERDAAFCQATSEALGGCGQVHHAEALLSGAVADESVDIVLGNPPYLRSIALGQADATLRERLRGHYAATSHGEWDLYAAFIEQGLAWLRPGGVLGMVVPSRWWSARWAGPLRETLAERRALRALIDFGDAQIFSDATVYSSVVLASADSESDFEVARPDGETWAVESFAAGELAERPSWNLAVGTDRAFVEALRGAGQPLGSMARIAKGTGTNADSVFVIPGPELGIESTVLRPMLRGRDIERLGEVPEWPQLLLPYGESGQLMDAEELSAIAPRALEHLRAHRHVLEARERGRFAGPAFYCFGRPQNLAFLQEPAPKVVVPDVTRGGRALVDARGCLVLDSAYAIRLHPDSDLSHHALCGVLSSTVVPRWLRSQGVPLRGGYTRVKTSYLSVLPMPSASEHCDELERLVLAKASAADIDEACRRAYGISPALWAHA